MTESYLTTDIIVIIVLVVVLVLVGIAAFLIHFYWTKIGIAEIWNTPKWSSMRSSFYRAINSFRQGREKKFVANDDDLSHGSIYADDVDDIAVEKNKTNPFITSYVTPTNNMTTRPVSIISYNHSVQNNYGRNLGQVDESHTKQSNDLASMIQKQRF